MHYAPAVFGKNSLYMIPQEKLPVKYFLALSALTANLVRVELD